MDYGLSAATAKSYEGTYSLDTLDENSTSCDADGPSILAAEPDRDFVITSVTSGTVNMLALGQCSGLADCLDALDVIRTRDVVEGDYSGYFTQEHDENSLYDSGFGVGTFAGGVCTGRTLYTNTLTRSGDSLRVERRTIPLPDAALDEGTCTSHPSPSWENEAAGRPCTDLRSFTGTKTGPLPG